MRHLSVAVAGLVGLLASTGCGGPVGRTQFAHDLEKQAGLSHDVAACVTDRLYARFDRATLERAWKADHPEQLPAGVEAAYTTAKIACEAAARAATSSSTTR